LIVIGNERHLHLWGLSDQRVESGSETVEQVAITVVRGPNVDIGRQFYAIIPATVTITQAAAWPQVLAKHAIYCDFFQ